MKRKVLFVIESLGEGGAEIVLPTIMKNLDRNRFDITVCVISGGGIYDKDIPEGVNAHFIMMNPDQNIGVRKVWYWFKYHLIYQWLPMWLVYYLYVPKGNDVEIAFVEGFATKLLASSTNQRGKKIAWVHCDLKNQPWPIMSKVYKNRDEEAVAYRKYDTVVCVSKVLENTMRELYGLINTVTIYNPIDVDSIKLLAKEKCEWTVDKSKFNIVSVGRLEKVKGYDMLIPLIRNIRDKGERVHLWIIGSGTEDQELKKVVKNLCLDTDVTFTGFMKNPYSLMSEMDLFVCSSRAEGFSLVIIEAMILGLPIVSMDCMGPRELITNFAYGVLCGSSEDLELQMLNHIKKKNMNVNISPQYDMKGIICQIENLLQSI